MGSSTLVYDILDVNTVVPLIPENQHLFDVDVSIIFDAQKLADAYTRNQLSFFFSAPAWCSDLLLKPATGSASKSRATSASFSLSTRVLSRTLSTGPALCAAADATPDPLTPTFLDTHFKLFSTCPKKGRPYSFEEFMNERGPMVSFLAKLGGVFDESDLLKAKWLLSIPSGGSCKRVEYIDAASILSGKVPKWQNILHSSRHPNVRAVVSNHLVRFQLVAPVKAGDPLCMVFGNPSPGLEARQFSSLPFHGPPAKRKTNPSPSSPTNPPKLPRLPEPSSPALSTASYEEVAFLCRHKNCKNPVMQSEALRGVSICDLCFIPSGSDRDCIKLGGACANHANSNDLQFEMETNEGWLRPATGTPSWFPPSHYPPSSPWSPGYNEYGEWVTNPGPGYSPRAGGPSLPHAEQNSKTAAKPDGLQLLSNEADRLWVPNVPPPSMPTNQLAATGAPGAHPLVLPLSILPSYPICSHWNCFCPVTITGTGQDNGVCNECNVIVNYGDTCYHCKDGCGSREPPPGPDGKPSTTTHQQECKPLFKWQDDPSWQIRDTAGHGLLALGVSLRCEGA